MELSNVVKEVQMSGLSREAIVSVLGPVDDVLATELAATGASEEELREAYAWLYNDESPINELRPLPKGRLAKLVDILESFELPPEEDA